MSGWHKETICPTRLLGLSNCWYKEVASTENQIVLGSNWGEQIVGTCGIECVICKSFVVLYSYQDIRPRQAAFKLALLELL